VGSDHEAGSPAGEAVTAFKPRKVEKPSDKTIKRRIAAEQARAKKAEKK